LTFTTRPEIAGTFGVVASTHWLASAAGMAVLEEGGNARAKKLTPEWRREIARNAAKAWWGHSSS
jgi:hypothetical protein